MQPAGDPLQPWHAVSVGARVRRGGGGYVHSVFARAVNLAGDHGSLTALLVADAPRVAHGVCLDERGGHFSRWFSPGAAFRWEGGDLCIASRFTASIRIATDGAEVWHGRVHCASGRPEAIARAAAALQRWRKDELCGQSALSPSPLTGEACGEGDSRAQRAMKLRLLALRDAYRADSAPAIAQAVHGLVGLGLGLTPAGDDALIGWLAGIALLGADCRCEVLRQAVRARLARTTDVSRAHLEDALAGEFSEPLAQFANALTRTRAEAQRTLANLAAVGATSGLDAAAGLLAALEAAAVKEPRRLALGQTRSVAQRET